jgi:hypothetical protein
MIRERTVLGVRELTEVTLRKTSTSIRVDPAFPRRKLTASTAAKPEPISELDRTGKPGIDPRARAVRPSAVPHVKGIENHAMPPRK